MEALLTSTILVAIAEIGDKTQLLSFMLAASLRKPWPIIGGILLATLANHALAGWVGTLFGEWVSATVLAWIIGLSFIGCGLWALHPDAFAHAPHFHRTGAFATAFVAFFLAEMGDKTQIATMMLAARFDSLLLVITGTTIGMMLANVPAVWIGETLVQKIPMQSARVLAAALFIIMGILTFWSAFAAT